MRPRSSLAPTLTAVLVLIGAGCGEKVDAPPDLSLVWTGSIHGFVEPCGCVAGQIGGIDRIASYVEEMRRGDPETLWVETGDLLLERHEVVQPILDQLPIKAEALFRVWGEIGCDAFGVGDSELKLGALRLRALGEAHGVPLLCANLVDSQGELVFQPSIVLERRGRKVGIFSLLAGKVDLPVVNEKGRIDVAALAAEQGLALLPWREVAIEVVRDLKEQGCDLILAASHLGFDRNRLLAETVPEIDVVFGPHFDKAEEEQVLVGNTPVLVSYVRGARIGRLDYWWPEPDEYFLSEGHGPLADVSAFTELSHSIRVKQDEFDDLLGREEALGSEEWERQRADDLAQMELFMLDYEQLGEPSTGNRFSHVAVPMHFGIKRSETAMRSVDRYHDELHSYWSELQAEFGPVDDTDYVGAEACIECHPAQYEFWRATRHSRAFATLAATKQEMDAECIGCHTAGYRQPNGFFKPHRHEGFENVQCGSCHGPGGPHVAGGTSYTQRNVMRSGRLACARCHDKDHDPDFAEEQGLRLSLVTCPPLEPPGMRAQPLIDVYIESAQIKERRPRPPWGDIALLYWKAGARAESLHAGRRWMEANPSSNAAINFTGQRLLDLGREAEALPLFQELVQRDTTHPEPWVGLSAALRPMDPRGALAAALEAWSLRPGQAELRAICLSHLAARDCGSARAAIGDYLAARPFEADLLADVLAEIERVCMTGGG